MFTKRARLTYKKLKQNINKKKYVINVSKLD